MEKDCPWEVLGGVEGQEKWAEIEVWVMGWFPSSGHIWGTFFCCWLKILNVF